MKLVLLKTFKSLPQGQLADYANNVINLMTEDPQFSTLEAEIATLKECCDVYTQALMNSMDGGRIKTILKNRAKKKLDDQLTYVARLVDYSAKKDERIILAAGFDILQPKKIYTSVDIPIILKWVNEQARGVVSLKLAKVEGAYLYHIEKRIKIDGQADDTSWRLYDDYHTTTLKTKLKGHESGNCYEWRCRSIGKSGLISGWSAVVSGFVS